MEDFKHINTWLFDLDNTLYNAETHVFVKMSERMAGFITERLQISREESNLLRKYYWKKYGTTLRGLMEEHNIDAHASAGTENYLHQRAEGLCRTDGETSGSRPSFRCALHH
jgi:FMN phosphatase YigB (HAD superfamily)